ncbi:MAG: hypothetical protein ACKN9T_13095 [Candidatus Methylumidiphilus sp.]
MIGISAAQAAWLNGYHIRSQSCGLPAVNPYPVQTVEHGEWADGWAEADREIDLNFNREVDIRQGQQGGAHV